MRVNSLIEGLAGRAGKTRRERMVSQAVELMVNLAIERAYDLWERHPQGYWHHSYSSPEDWLRALADNEASADEALRRGSKQVATQARQLFKQKTEVL